MASPDPERIGRYIVQGVLGRGAMGIIYRAHDPDIDRAVAIKLIRADLVDGEDRAEFLERFRREAQSAGRCSHANIVAVHDFSVHDGNPFLAMEFIEGVNLAQLLLDSGRGLAAPRAVMLMGQVLDALAAAHALGVVHRDIKPPNILVMHGDRVKVADFGISRLENSGLTQDGALLGSPAYMAPEQCRGVAIDARTDLYAAGVVLFELLSGRKPFAGASMAAVFAQLLNEPPPDLGVLCPGLPPGLVAAVHRALEKDPANRFASAAEMAQALRAGLMTASDATVVMPSAAVSAPALDEAELEAMRRDLAHHVGPVASVLIRRARAQTASLAALRATLAQHIENEADRAAFMNPVEATVSGLRRRTS